MKLKKNLAVVAGASAFLTALYIMTYIIVASLSSN
jgi:hypothetical protein